MAESRSLTGQFPIYHQVDEFTNRPVGFQCMSQFFLNIDRVSIPSAVLGDANDTCGDEFRHDSLYRPFSNANLNRHLPCRELWTVGQADEYVGVVAEKGPVLLGVVFHV